MRPLFAPIVLIAFLAAPWLPPARGHQISGVNLELIAELTEEEFTYELSVETSLLPPLDDVAFGDPLPALEDRREAIESWFAEHCPVRIDGIAVAPILTNFQCSEMDDQLNLGKTEDFVMAYLILTYPIKSKPQTIDMTWDVFLPDAVLTMQPETPELLTGEPHNPQLFECIFYTNGELDMMSFSPDEPQFIWHTTEPLLSVDAAARLQREAVRPAQNLTRVPLAWPIAAGLLSLGGVVFFRQGKRLAAWQALALVASLGVTAAASKALTLTLESGSEKLDVAAAAQRFKDLHQNIYRAFDYDTDEQIYDTLAQSVSGDLLDRIYQEIYKSLVMKEEGGAVCRVKRLEYLDTDVRPAPEGEDFAVRCHWRVFGLVEHWGHIHQRVNEYEADYRLGLREGRWRIADVAIAKEKRLDPQSLEAIN